MVVSRVQWTNRPPESISDLERDVTAYSRANPDPANEKYRVVRRGGGGGSSGGGAPAPGSESIVADVTAGVPVPDRPLPPPPSAPVRKVEIQTPAQQRQYGEYVRLTQQYEPGSQILTQSEYAAGMKQKLRSEIGQRPISGTDVGLFFIPGALLGKFGTMVSRAVPVVSRAASRVPGGAAVVQATGRAIQTGAQVVSRVPKPARDIAGGVAVAGGYVASAQAPTIAKERGAESLERRVNLPRSQGAGFLESTMGGSIRGGLTGSIREEVSPTGEVVSRAIIRPEVGGEDLLGTGQRFALDGVPGLTPFFAPESTRAAVEKELKARGIPATEQNIRAATEELQLFGFLSTLGIIGSEVSSEVGVGRYARGGSAALRAAKTVKQQERALGRLIIPPTFVAGVAEGASQTYNIETLTKREADVGRVIMGGGIGGASAGVFSFFTSRAVPRGYGKAVTAVGYGFDFPGEPGGDVGGRLIMGGTGLRIPVVTLSPGGAAPSIVQQAAPAAPKGRAKVGIIESVFTPTRTVTLGGRTVPVDEFGLPVMDIVETPSRIGTPSIVETPTRTTIPEQINIFGPTETTTEVSVAAQTNINVPSTVNVPTLVPTGLPLFPPGRLGGEGGGGGRRSRLGYFDEFAAAFGATFGEGRAVSRGKAPRRGRAQPIFGKGSEFAGFNALVSQRGRPSRKKSVRGRPAGFFRFGVFR